MLLLGWLLLVWIVLDHCRRLPLRSTTSSIAIVVNSLVLNLEALVANLEAIHLFNSRFG